ncbi:AI-2E family transporter [Methanoplanus sp. FWC-SCC4]|uniref:AI-2E family transporter n=1 Tax=Methanochimaera problematica TaxID=2609417 RepID=A0AA97FEP9_9EURY|nr:AI-2E family transporter [Methanoplanus sp. FWC-SCC4]WOF16673.1 AI-2E family transporter [Methanoplanus sp. FWC-SCC4]
MEKWEIFSFGVVLIIFAAALIAFWEFAAIFVVAVALAAVLMPAQRYLEEYMKPAFSSLLITCISAFLIIMAIYVSSIVLYSNLDYLKEMLVSITSWFGDAYLSTSGSGYFNPLPFISDFTSAIILWVKETTLEFLVILPLIAIKVMILFLAVFLLLEFGDDLSGQIRELIPEKSRDDIEILDRGVMDMLYALFNVHVVIAVIVFFLSFPVFYVLGYGHIFFYAVLSGILALIPVFGPVFLIAFLVVYSVSISDIRGLLIVLILGWPLLCAIPDWWMRPFLMGKRASVNSVLMFIAFFGGIAVMGIFGFIMGPVFVALIIGGYKIIRNNYGLAGAE